MLDDRTRLLIDNEFLEVFARRGSSAFTLVTFSSFGVYADGASYWGQGIAEKLDLSCIGIMSRAETWFPDASMEHCLPAILSMLRGRVLVYGSSMGAYAAIKYSRRLEADTVIAFSPQATISDADLPGNPYAAFFRRELHVGMRVKFEDLGGQIYLFYDRLFRDDRAQVALLPSSERIRVVPVEALRHDAVLVVLGTAVVAELFRLCLARDEAGIGALIRSAKRRSPATYEGLSLHFLQRRKHRWATAAHDMAQSISDSDARLVRFTREKSVILENEGRCHAAADTLRLALKRVPQSETLLVRVAEVLNALGAHKDAVDAFKRAIRADGRRPAVYHGLVDAMIRAGLRSEILPAIQHGLKLCPADHSLQLLERQFNSAAPETNATKGKGRRPSNMDSHIVSSSPEISLKGAPMHDLLGNQTSSSHAAPNEPLFHGRAPTGDNYQLVLQRFHQTFRPATYLEIGVNEGATLRLSRSRTIAVDPHFRGGQVPVGDQPVFCLFQMTSDIFFQQHDPTAILGQPIDMAFLDGMHWFEFLLRDFINTEKHCKRNSVVFLHDCLPLDAHVGRRLSNDGTLRNRSACPDWWAGDVWKTLLVIVRHRVDLRVVLFDAAPTGLVAITGLDPSSTVLADRYFDLVEEFSGMSLMDQGHAELNRLPVLDTAKFTSHDALSGLFWL